MKTDKLFYRIFLQKPELISELVPGVPADCHFDYSAPVLKERERRLDGLLTPRGDDPHHPLVFLEAQMQKDDRFYGRFFSQIFLYLEQYQIRQQWRGLLLFPRRSLNFGYELPYETLFDNQVQRFYLEDLIPLQDLSPNLQLLRLLVLSPEQAITTAEQLLQNSLTSNEFRQQLDLVETIMLSKFPTLSSKEIRQMLHISDVDLEDTVFYKEVFGLGREEGQMDVLMRLLSRRCGDLSTDQQRQLKSLSIEQRDSLFEALLDFSGMSDLEQWLATHQSDPTSA